MTTSDYTTVFTEDLIDMAKLCHGALAQDSPEDPYYYLNQLLGYVTGYLSLTQREVIEKYLAEKEYLPPLKLILDET